MESPATVNRLTFTTEVVRRLTSSDFETEKRELITLKNQDCILVLFYVENPESYELAKIWAAAAQQVAGPTFAAINMMTEKSVATAFTRLKSDGSNPLHWAALKQYPFIMVYRSGWPVAVYNGPREVQALIDYSLTLACQAGYYETMQVGGSMSVDNNLSMPSYSVYLDVAGQPPVVKRTSLQFGPDQYIRGYASTPSSSQPLNPTNIPVPSIQPSVNPITGEPTTTAGGSIPTAAALPANFSQQ